MRLTVSVVNYTFELKSTNIIINNHTFTSTVFNYFHLQTSHIIDLIVKLNDYNPGKFIDYKSNNSDTCSFVLSFMLQENKVQNTEWSTKQALVNGGNSIPS